MLKPSWLVVDFFIFFSVYSEKLGLTLRAYRYHFFVVWCFSKNAGTFLHKQELLGLCVNTSQIDSVQLSSRRWSFMGILIGYPIHLRGYGGNSIDFILFILLPDNKDLRFYQSIVFIQTCHARPSTVNAGTSLTVYYRRLTGSNQAEFMSIQTTTQLGWSRRDPDFSWRMLVTPNSIART